MALKTYHGSCHCGAIKYEVDLDLANGTGKCNCSICTKTRNWSARAEPDPSGFRLISGGDNLTDYQFNTHSSHNVFCKICGVRSYGYGDIKEAGGPYVSVQVACLDDATVDELMSGPIRTMNGRDNDGSTRRRIRGRCRRRDIGEEGRAEPVNRADDARARICY